MNEIVQGSPEWKALRLGKVTASRIDDVCARTQKGWAAGRKNYMADLITERLTGVPTEGYTNAAMQWGTDHEPEARAEYQFKRNVRVQRVAFVPHPTIADSGASPDGLVRDDGLVEIKCPNTATHIETLQGAPLPEKYFFQIQWQLACTERQWCDFVSYDPRLPEAMRLHVERITREDTVIQALEKDVTDFLNELGLTVYQLRKKFVPETADLPEAARYLLAG